ncbi:MAG: hypothetical protein LBD29_03595 [Treponema sp.]|jgi:hypothetical protein|nr:hypothetical protein [Treponema sp.]
MNINGVEVMSVAEIAAELKIASGTASMRLRRRNIPPFAYLGCMTFYKKEDIDKIREKSPRGRAAPNYGQGSSYTPQLANIGVEQ